MASTSTRFAAILFAGFAIAATPAIAEGHHGGGGGARSGGGHSGGGQTHSGGSHSGGGQARSGGGEHRSGENRGGESRSVESRGVENRGGERFVAPREGVVPRGPVVAPRNNYGYRPNVVVPRAVVPSYRSYGYRPYNGYRSYGYSPYVYRPYGWRPGLGLNFYFGRPYVYGYPTYLYGTSAAYGYYAVAPGHSYGELRIVDAPGEAQVYVDGSYAGVVDDFDGAFQHLNLEAGPHHIEIVADGLEPYAFDVNIAPGQSLTYHARF